MAWAESLGRALGRAWAEAGGVLQTSVVGYCILRGAYTYGGIVNYVRARAPLLLARRTHTPRGRRIHLNAPRDPLRRAVPRTKHAAHVSGTRRRGAGAPLL